MSEKYRHGVPASYERNEAAEVFRATLGFDFIFTRDDHDQLHCYCIEINGHDSGIKGVQDIPKDDLNPNVRQVADIRATEDADMARRRVIAREVLTDLSTGDFDATIDAKKKIHAYVKKSISERPIFTHAYENPTLIEELTNDKRLQSDYIPEKYRPRPWHRGADIISATGAWVIKEPGSRSGEGVRILTNTEFAEFVTKEGGDIDQYAIQEFVPSAGAEATPLSWGHRAAAMRLLVDFRYLEDGSIVPDYSIAYQRVSPHKVDSEEANAKGLTRGDVLVVNRERGAKSVAASPEEERLAKEASLAIIKNIARDYVFAMHRDERQEK